MKTVVYIQIMWQIHKHSVRRLSSAEDFGNFFHGMFSIRFFSLNQERPYFIHTIIHTLAIIQNKARYQCWYSQTFIWESVKAANPVLSLTIRTENTQTGFVSIAHKVIYNHTGEFNSDKHSHFCICAPKLFKQDEWSDRQTLKINPKQTYYIQVTWTTCLLRCAGRK